MFPLLIAIAHCANEYDRVYYSYKYLNISTDEVVELSESIMTSAQYLDIGFNVATKETQGYALDNPYKHNGALLSSMNMPSYKKVNGKIVEVNNDLVVLVCQKKGKILAADMWGTVKYLPIDVANQLIAEHKAVFLDPSYYVSYNYHGQTVAFNQGRIFNYKRIPKEVVEATIQRVEEAVYRCTALGLTEKFCSVLTRTLQQAVTTSESRMGAYTVDEYDMLPLFDRLFSLVLKYQQHIVISASLEVNPILTLFSPTTWTDVMITGLLPMDELVREYRGGFRFPVENRRMWGYYVATTMDGLSKKNMESENLRHNKLRLKTAITGYRPDEIAYIEPKYKGAMSGIDSSDLSLTFMGTCEDLGTVNIMGSAMQELDVSKIPENMALYLHNCPNLKAIRGSNIKRLHLQDIDGGLSIVKDRPTVEMLSLKNCKCDVLDLSRVKFRKSVINLSGVTANTIKAAPHCVVQMRNCDIKNIDKNLRIRE